MKKTRLMMGAVIWASAFAVFGFEARDRACPPSKIDPSVGTESTFSTVPPMIAKQDEPKKKEKKTSKKVEDKGADVERDPLLDEVPADPSTKRAKTGKLQRADNPNDKVEWDPLLGSVEAHDKTKVKKKKASRKRSGATAEAPENDAVEKDLLLGDIEQGKDKKKKKKSSKTKKEKNRS